MEPLPEPLVVLARTWRNALRGPRRNFVLVALSLVTTIALLLARYGTLRTRLGALAILGVAVSVLATLAWRERRIFRDATRTIRRVAAPVEPELAGRAERALSLVGPGAAPGTSPELAELHVTRALAALPREAVRRGAARLGMMFGVAAVVLAIGNIGACASSPWAPFEGADVLAAKGGIAPVGMDWLSGVELHARPPDYLHQEEPHVLAYDEESLPRGTLLTFRGTPLHAGRRLLLTDGAAEVPFVDDGSGHVVARWPLAETVKLRVVARFGDVIVPESRDTDITSIADEAPVVFLETAPRQVRLSGAEGDAREIPIHYEARDDHGLREVHLVLRAGAREERRVLARLDGETRLDRGGYSLRTTDPFVKKSHAPIEVRVEAKDNDPITGPKWGASDAITIVPPDVGEGESLRLAGLVVVRDALVEALAFRFGSPLPTEIKERRAYLEQDAKLSDDAKDLLDRALSTSHAGGVRVPARLGAMLRGRMRKLAEAVKNQARSPSTTAHANEVKASERMVLVVDAAIQGLGLRDTRDVAHELADVADDLALAATIAQRVQEKTRGEQRMDAADIVLTGGARSMKKLGSLGRDLGEIVDMDLARIARSRQGADLVHTTLAAQDLAARLHQPDPSFGAKGGRPSHAGGESGGGRGASTGDDEGEGSDVEQAFNEAVRDLERLASDHAAQIGKVEQALAGGGTDDDQKAMAEEAKKRAERVREAVRPLPSIGGGSDTWTGRGAAAREHAEQMAKALEAGNAADAVQSGRNALGALDEAKRMLARERWNRFTDPNADRSIDDARHGIEAELKWSEGKLDEMRKRAASRAAPELRDNAEGESKLADRAHDVGKKGREQELPEGAVEALREAERLAREASGALRDSDAEKALRLQRDAQRKLEEAKDALGDGEGKSDAAADRDDGEQSSGHADIPNADTHKGPEEFRRRVIKGLATPGGRYKDAVRRYAEGLLR